MEEGLTRVPCKGGAQIAVHHFGGEGPSLIVLAANGFVPKVYLPMVKPRQSLLSLSGRRICCQSLSVYQVAHLKAHFTCYGIDLRGHGNSPSGPGTDLQYHGSDVATVVQSLKLRGLDRLLCTLPRRSFDKTNTGKL